jgi:hypothetical protein
MWVPEMVRLYILYQQSPKTRLQWVRYAGKKRSLWPRRVYPALLLPSTKQTDP